jgi:hypothetical protein
MMIKETGITPFDNCPALDGYHCQTVSLAKIFRYHNAALSEEMLFGLGSGMGFTYWHPKNGIPCIGGRGNAKSFFEDVGNRTGVEIGGRSTSSPKKAEALLLAKLRNRKPAMIFGEPGLLPWRLESQNQHSAPFTFVVCGYDGNGKALASDIDPASKRLKKGTYHPISLAELAQVRASTAKPFPPGNAWLDFDFGRYKNPEQEDIMGAVRKNAEAMLHPSISNLGVRGIRRTSREILLWHREMSEAMLASCLFNMYVSVEIGGTGGGCFRQMYSRFLLEAASVASNRMLKKASVFFEESANLFSEAAAPFADPANNVRGDNIATASALFSRIADIEEKAFDMLYE